MKVTSQGQKFIEKMCRVTECSLTVTTCPEEQAQRESIFLLVPSQVSAHKHVALLFRGLW